MLKKISPRTHRYYVGSPMAMRSDWAKKSFEDAVAHATKLCEADSEEHFVVKVVAIVRPKQRPVTVERIK